MSKLLTIILFYSFIARAESSKLDNGHANSFYNKQKDKYLFTVSISVVFKRIIPGIIKKGVNHSVSVNWKRLKI